MNFTSGSHHNLPRFEVTCTIITVIFISFVILQEDFLEEEEVIPAPKLQLQKA